MNTAASRRSFGASPVSMAAAFPPCGPVTDSTSSGRLLLTVTGDARCSAKSPNNSWAATPTR
jgi:hypothetical protein